MTRALTYCLLLVTLAGCALWPFGKGGEKKDPDENTTEQILYRSAQSSLRAGNYRDGITKLQRLEARFPFGRYAEQAQLELIYAHHMAFEPEAARAAADRFIRLHPQHPNADYAFYMKGLTSFNEERGMLDRFAGADIARRDQTSNRQAFADFAALLARYPDSEYAADAHQRMLYLRNLLADSEVRIADYYMRRSAYVAAANRARNVVEHYGQSIALADALAIMVEANWRLGLNEAANDALRVMSLNFPNHPGFNEKGEFVFKRTVLNRDRSWLNLMTWGLLDRPDVPPPIRIQLPAS